ncbi:hypothetical protein ABE504_14550 [Paenibacillus oryzisoli]|uniref:hypothetical protein n=1 Tax=Paenibacillus oryzisoli TaxID=1850517 RepID=UPI003D2BB136
MSYDLVIIGATTTALGLAQTVQGSLKTLIVNATEMVAYDVVNNYKQPEVYTQGAAYNKQFRDLQADVLLGTDVVRVTKRENGGGYILELLNIGDFRTVEAKFVVDTTMEREETLTGKSLNAIIIQQKGEKLPLLTWPGFSIVSEQHEHKYRSAILKFDCAPDWNVAEARHRLIDLWLERPEPLQNWKIAAMAFCFEERTTSGLRTRDVGYTALPAASFAEPEESIAAGIELGRSLITC